MDEREQTVLERRYDKTRDYLTARDATTKVELLRDRPEVRPAFANDF